jgi:hypothetical protein
MAPARRRQEEGVATPSARVWSCGAREGSLRDLTPRASERDGLSGRGVAQPGSAHAWGACGRPFKSAHPDQSKTLVSVGFRRFANSSHNFVSRRLCPILCPPRRFIKRASSKTTSLQRRYGTAARFNPDMSIPSQHSIVDVPCKLPNRLNGHAWVFCQPRDECVARVVEPARDAASLLCGLERPLVIPLAHRATKVDIPERADLFDLHYSVERKQIVRGLSVREPCQPGDKRFDGPIRQRNNASRSTFGF